MKAVHDTSNLLQGGGRALQQVEAGTSADQALLSDQELLDLIEPQQLSKLLSDRASAGKQILQQCCCRKLTRLSCDWWSMSLTEP